MKNDTSIDLDNLFAPKKEEQPQPQKQEEVSKPVVSWDEILTEWSYRLPKGYPTIVDGVFTEYEEVKILNEIMEERFGETLPLPEAKPAKDFQAALRYVTNALTQRVLGDDLGKVTLRPFLTKDNIIRLETIQASRASVATKLAKALNADLNPKTNQSFTFVINGNKYLCVVKPTTAETKTDTDVKEGLSVVMSYYPEYLTGNEYDKDKITKDNFKEVSKKLLQFIKSGGVNGLDEAPLESCVSFLKKGEKLTAPSDIKKYVDILNQNSSHANTFDLFFQKNKNWYIDRTKALFESIRETAVECSKTKSTPGGLPKDKWCPGDIYFIKNGAEDQIREAIRLAKAQPNPQGLTILNDLFSNKFLEPEADKVIVAVSLKMEDAQAGKLKSALEMYTNIKTDYTLDDADLKGNFADLVKKADLERKKTLGFVKSGDVDVEWSPCDLTKVRDEKKPNDPNANTRTLACKLAAYKALNFIKEKVADNKFAQLDDALVSLVVFGLGVINKSPDTELNDLIQKKSVNPPFFKVIASKSGNGMAKPLLFQKGKLTTISLWDVTGNNDPKIVIEDRPTFAGITIKMGVQVGKDKFDCAVAFRPNVTGSKQITIELQKAEHHD
jgi:hypothetical protein